MQGETTVRNAIISSDITTEWKMFHQFMAKQPKSDIKSQLKELWSTEMSKPMFANLNTLAAIDLSIPVSGASIKRSFSQMKLIKMRLCSSLCDSSLSPLMKISTESPDALADGNLEDIVDVWNRKCRRIPV